MRSLNLMSLTCAARAQEIPSHGSNSATYDVRKHSSDTLDRRNSASAIFRPCLRLFISSSTTSSRWRTSDDVVIDLLVVFCYCSAAVQVFESSSTGRTDGTSLSLHLFRMALASSNYTSLLLPVYDLPTLNIYYYNRNPN